MLESEIVFFQKRNELLDAKVGKFEISYGHGGGRGCPEYLAHTFKGSSVSDDINAFVFVAVFFEVGFNVDAPGASGFDVNGHDSGWKQEKFGVMSSRSLYSRLPELLISLIEPAARKLLLA